MKKHTIDLKKAASLITKYFVLAIMLYSPVFSQSKTGTTIGQFLLIEPSSKHAGMGNTGVASYDDLLSAYYNPGALGRLNNSGISFTHSLWLADIVYDHAAVNVKLDADKALSLCITSLNSGDIDVRTVEKPEGTGEKYTVNNFAIGLGYGQAISERFSVGLRVNYVQENIWHCSLSTVGFDIGTIYRLSPDGLRIGASISNFGLPGKYEGRDLRITYDYNDNTYGDNSALPAELYTDEFHLPVLFRVGLFYPFILNNDNKIDFEIDAYHPNDNYESISVGADWTFMNLISFRAGYQNLFLTDSEAGLTLGSGLYYVLAGYELKFDYAWNKYGRIGNTQRMTLSFAF
jgi:hypothetical protein